MTMESAYFKLKKMKGRHDIKEIKQQLDTLPGVVSASYSTKNDLLAVDFDNTGTDHGQIKNTIHDLGFMIIADSTDEHSM